jgi:hypothetical protein
LWKQYKEDSTFKDQLSESDKKLLDEYINQYTKIVETRKQKETEELKRKEEEELDKELSKPIPIKPLSSLTIDYGWTEIKDPFEFATYVTQKTKYQTKTKEEGGQTKYFIKEIPKLVSNGKPIPQNVKDDNFKNRGIKIKYDKTKN